MTRRINRREFLGAAVASTAAMTVVEGAPAVPERPNVLFILADDLGYGDLSCYGRPDYRTPVLDGLARQGVRFTSAYAAAPVCTPTRCSFITGRYAQRFPVGLREPLIDPTDDVGLPVAHPTVASLLRDNNYETALLGKWHLGWKPEFGPNRHGYDEFFGVLSGASDYFTHRAEDFKGPDLWENLAPVERVGYLTNLLSDRAVEFVTRRRTRPFFLSLQYTAPHSPWEGPEDVTISHEHGAGPMDEGGSLSIYGSMVRSMDQGIGRVLAALDRGGLARRTLVIFTSDNGGERYSFNWPFSFEKMYLSEGGIRVPAILRWPGVICAEQTTDQAAITMDWAATILAVTATEQHPGYSLDGENLLPVCTGVTPVHDRELFWRTRERAAARMGRWKYLQESGVERLFDLVNDPGEKTDLRSKRSDVFARIRTSYGTWNEQMLPRP
jgi:arylsulfatase A-like enzyme